MTIEFNLDAPGHDAYVRAQLRLLIGDTLADDGPRPNKGNYQDNELDVFLSLEAGDLNRAVARGLETLAAEWSRYAGAYRLGPESEEMRQAAEFANRAAVMREQHGYTVGGVEGANADGSGFVDWSVVYASWIGKF